MANKPDAAAKPAKDAKPAPAKKDEKPASAPAAVPVPAPAPKPARIGVAPSTPPKTKGPRSVHAPEKFVERTNVMQRLRVSKVTVNIGVGQAGERLEKAEKVLANLTQRKPVRTVSRSTIRDWNIREGMPIGVKVTLRGNDAVAFAKRALWTRNFRVAEWSFDKEGNLLFGVPDHTAFEGQKYNPEIGIFGMDVAVTIERPGFRVKHRRRLQKRVPHHHRVTRTESQAYLKQILGIEVV